MRRPIVYLAAFLTCALMQAQSIPDFTPGVGQARIKVCGQNMQNYFINLQNSFSSCETEEQLQTKTEHIVTAFLNANADIYSMCELECNNQVMEYLTNAMNQAAGGTDYAYVSDNIEDSGDGATKVGFIYRPSKVRPVGTIQQSSSSYVYKKRMRWVVFEEIATGERFVMSMNHFKAKSSDSDTNSQRMTNARDLYNAMSQMKRQDPDIVVMGDLNCTTDEEPIQYLINTAGLEEQLVKYNADAYSYRYSGANQLIDHAMANSTAATQVTGAGVCHLNTNRTWLRYSDHDLYMIGLNLGDHPDINPTEPVVLLDEPFSTGQGDFTIWDAQKEDGLGDIWTFDSRYGMKGTAYTSGTNHESESWLLSPTLALTNDADIVLTFDHTYRYANHADEQLTLHISTDYNAAHPEQASWTQLEIPHYPSGTDWTFVSSGDIDLSDYAGQNATLGFRYRSTSSNAGTWEIKNVHVVATPHKHQTSLQEQTAEPSADKMLVKGQILIIRGEQLYTIGGQRVL